MQPPAAVVKPDFTPTTPLDPISVTRLWTVPTTGRVLVVTAATSAKVGMAIPTAATFNTSTADDTVCGSKPLAST